jgi:3'-phosphoadenosine 5'-phosphosulfate sulfotransferase (PAPS reductase)/FAD synthetase
MLVNQPGEKMFVFANTGEEDERTLEFVDRCDKEWGLNVVWVEAEVSPTKRVGTSHRIVTFETATRGPSLFERMIEKYGIPNKSAPHCTRELKQSQSTGS